MLIRVFEFSQMAVRQVMVPRTEMIAIPSNITYRQFLALTARERHTRLPVYEGNLDHIVGVLYAKDLLPGRFGPGGRITWQGLVRPVEIVPEVKTLDRQLRDSNLVRRGEALERGVRGQLLLHGPISRQDVRIGRIGIRILCDYLTLLGFLTKPGDRYAITQDSAVFLNRKSPAYAGGTLAPDGL